jgi:ligand-binding sensor domain-containing protein
MGKPLMCLCTPSTFTADKDSLWVGIGGQLLQLGFDLKTNLTVNLPMDASTTITAIWAAETKVWIATDGDGLIEFDKNSHASRRFTVEDGLTMNRIACLYLADDTLWIGYGYKPEFGTFGMNPDVAQSGGLGQMDVASHKFLSFTPSIAKHPDAKEANSDYMLPESTSNPPRRAVQAVVAGPDGTGWFATINSPLRCYRKDQNVWEGVPSINGRSLAIDAAHLFVGQNWGFQAALGGPLGIHILNLKEDKWHDVGAFDGLPSASVNTLTLDGDRLWIGGVGYIALLDPAHEKVLNLAYVPGSGVDRIQVAGGYVWAQFDWHLYRAPLSALP